MERLHVLGTGHAMVTHCYNTCFAIERDGDWFLVDAGGGNRILRILDDKGIDPCRMRSLFLTHLHTDHALGMVWVLRRIAERMLAGRLDGCVDFYAHAEAADGLQTICRMTMKRAQTDLFGGRIRFHAVSDGDEVEILGDRVRFFDIRSTKMRQFGFEMALSDGQRLVCLGDEPCDPACEPVARGADWLLSEAFCRYEDRERYRPYEKHHATARDAALLAGRVGARRLVLWHGEEQTLADRPALYGAEARAVFGGEVYVPRDGDVIPLGGESE